MTRVGGGTGAATEAAAASRLADFWLDDTEVPLGAYRECVRAGRCVPAIASSPFCNEKLPDREQHPVNCVSQEDAAAYCAFVGRRLPTEAEWEWAARGGAEGRAYPWGEGEPDAQLCWRRADAGTCPVSSFPAGASAHGLADLAGNVWEWTSSRWTAKEQGAVVFRGGSWRDAKPAHFRAAHRAQFLAAGRSDAVGFRCALSAR